MSHGTSVSSDGPQKDDYVSHDCVYAHRTNNGKFHEHVVPVCEHATHTLVI